MKIQSSFSVLLLTLLMSAPAFRAFAQNPAALHFRVLAVHGSVYHHNQILNKNDVFTVSDAGELLTGFRFGAASDWIKVMETKTGSTRTCYAQQQSGSKNHYLFTRSSGAITNDNELLYFFKRSSIFLFEDDTLVCEGLQKYKTDENHLLVLQYKAEGKIIRKTIGRNDSIFLTKQIFVTESGSISSFEVDSIQLLYYNVHDNQHTCFDLSPFCIYFFCDVVKDLKKLGMKQDETFAELSGHFVSIEEIQKQQGFNDISEAEAWLRDKIKKAWKK